MGILGEVGFEGRELIVVNSGESPVDARNDAPCEVVRTNGTGDSIVVKSYTSRLGSKASPNPTAGCSNKALRRVNTCIFRIL